MADKDTSMDGSARSGVERVLRTAATYSFCLIMLAVAALSLPFSAFAADTDLFNYPGTSLRGVSSAEVSVPIDKCKSICTERHGCVGYDYVSKGNACRIFQSISSGHDDADATAGTRALLTPFRDPTNPPLASRLAKLKESDPSGAGLFALSKDAYAAGDRTIGYQAITLAVQRGNQDAKLEIARWYDPRTFSADKVDAADANKAARSYFELALSGNPQAQTLLNTLCQESIASSSTYATAFESFLGTTYCEGSIGP